MVKCVTRKLEPIADSLQRLKAEGSEYIHYFGLLFHHRFEETGKLEDINNALRAYGEARSMVSVNDSTYPAYLHGIGSCFLSRSSLTESETSVDIKRAISNLQEAVDLSKEYDVGLPERLSGWEVLSVHVLPYPETS
jgi:hypothetical protein